MAPTKATASHSTPRSVLYADGDAAASGGRVALPMHHEASGGRRRPDCDGIRASPGAPTRVRLTGLLHLRPDSGCVERPSRAHCEFGRSLSSGGGVHEIGSVEL